MLTALAFAAALLAQDTGAQDAPIVTAGQPSETTSELRLREALAYSNPMPRGAPDQDYPLVAWCDALVSGHVRLGESLNSTDPLDLDIIRLGKLEATDFRSALATAAPRQTAATRTAAQAAATEGASRWAPLLAQENVAARSQSFGLFFGLPGRCEHAARRIRENITTPPATLADVGLRSEGVDPAQ